MKWLSNFIRPRKKFTAKPNAATRWHKFSKYCFEKLVILPSSSQNIFIFTDIKRQAGKGYYYVITLEKTPD